MIRLDDIQEIRKRTGVGLKEGVEKIFERI